MTQRQIVESFSLPYEYHIPCSGNLRDLIRWATDVVEQYGPHTEFNLWFGHEGWFDMTLQIQRDETKAERKRRLDAAAKKRDREMESERKLYEKLKKKFE